MITGFVVKKRIKKIMKVEIVTAQEAERLGLTHSILTERGHGAFGEPDNSYANVVYVGDKQTRLFDDSLVIFIKYKSKFDNRKVIQVISEYNCSDKLLEILNPEALIERKNDKYDNYIELKREIESDDFYTKPLSGI